MIQAEEAIRVARGLIGTSYETLDCINLIKKVIRTAPGGDKRYTTAGTNELWNSFDSVPKYRHLIWRQAGINCSAGIFAESPAAPRRKPFCAVQRIVAAILAAPLLLRGVGVPDR